MSNIKHTLLMGACALGFAGMSGSANAATSIYGGGSSLISFYMVQAFNCYGNPQQLIIRSPLALQTVPPFNYTPSHGTAQDCSTTQVNTNANLFYDSASSGVGIAGVFSHDPSSAAPNGYGDIDPATPGEQDMPAISFGMSDAGLSATDVGYWNNGNDNNGPSNPSSTPEQGVTVVAPGETASPPTTYPNPLQTRGPMVQIPVSVDPIAFAYDTTYKKVADSLGNVTSYHFNIHFPDTNGGLRMDRTTYCAIFNATAGGTPITSWNDPTLKTLNGGVSLQDPQDITDNGAWGAGNPAPTLQIAGRGDSSGTTSIFTRHLSAVCGAGNNYGSAGATTLPSGLRGGTYDPVTDTASGVTPGLFTLATGSGALAKYVAFRAVPTAGQTLQQGNLAYIGADWVVPNNSVNGTNTYNLNAADLKNSSNHWEPPTGAQALQAFGSLTPPQSNADGTYDDSSCSGPTAACRAHPYDWVQGLSNTSPLADPSDPQGYPVVGTTNGIFYTCYSTTARANVASKFTKWYTGNATVQENPDGLLAKNGLSSLPPAWRTAINETFTANTLNTGFTNPLNLDIQNSTTCSGVSGG